MIPKRAKWALRYALTALTLGLLLLIGLAVSGIIHLPGDAVAIWGLALPVLIGGALSGFIAPLVPGALMLLFGRFREGDQVIIGPESNPTAKGTVTRIDFYLTHLRDDDGRSVTVANQIVHGLTVTRL